MKSATRNHLDPGKSATRIGPVWDELSLVRPRETTVQLAAAVTEKPENRTHSSRMDQGTSELTIRPGPEPVRSDPNNSRSRIILAKPEDLPFILDLSRKHSEAVGWIPAEGMEQYMRWRLVTMAILNDQPAGYLLCKHDVKDLPSVTQVHQACVCYDVRLRKLGLSLVRKVELAAATAGNGVMQLWCAADLEANDFWKAAGFSAWALREGGEARGRPHIMWRKAVCRSASLSVPPSSRRRGAAGIPIVSPIGDATDVVMDAFREGRVLHLLRSWEEKTSSLPRPKGKEWTSADAHSNAADSLPADSQPADSLASIRRLSSGRRVAPAI